MQNVTNLYGESAAQRLRTVAEPMGKPLGDAAPLFATADDAAIHGLLACAALIKSEGSGAILIRAAGGAHVTVRNKHSPVSVDDCVAELNSGRGLLFTTARLTQLDGVCAIGLRFFGCVRHDAFSLSVPSGDSELKVSLVTFADGAGFDVEALRSMRATAFVETESSTINDVSGCRFVSVLCIFHST